MSALHGFLEQLRTSGISKSRAVNLEMDARFEAGTATVSNGWRKHRGKPQLWRKGDPRKNLNIAKRSFNEAKEYEVSEEESPLLPWESIDIRNAAELTSIKLFTSDRLDNPPMILGSAAPQFMIQYDTIKFQRCDIREMCTLTHLMAYLVRINYRGGYMFPSAKELVNPPKDRIYNQFKFKATCDALVNPPLDDDDEFEWRKFGTHIALSRMH